MARIAIFAAGLLLTACGPESRPAGEPASDARAGESMDVIDALAEPARQARRDLARRTGIPEDAIGVVAAEFVTWPDSALGCPEPGMMYMQVLTPGYRIRLETPDGVHHYHGAKGQPPFHCPAERANPPAKTGDAGTDPRV
jgi:hypothetical protein